METIYDWVSLGIFAGLVVLFLQRSTGDRGDKDVSLLYYLAAGVGCAVANYFGNEDQHVLAVLLIIATLAYIYWYLKPFSLTPKA